MASLGFVETLLNGIPDTTTRSVLKQVFTEVLKFGRFGPVEHQEPTQIGARVYLTSTTSSTANDEVSIQHGLGRTPYLALQVVPLDSTGWQFARLKISRAADSQRIYLTSADSNAPIFLMVE